MAKPLPTLERGTLSFSVEARILRELGERLVRRPETALNELIKNAYDADASECSVQWDAATGLSVSDNGVGMTLGQFKSGWMRIGTATKAGRSETELYGRPITGEKGIGRFSVRFLGAHLSLTSIADDAERGVRTKLTAEFDWPAYDASEDLGRVKVPYTLRHAAADEPTGTTLDIGKLRTAASDLDLKKVRSASIGLISPLRSLLAQYLPGGEDSEGRDPGFRVVLEGEEEEQDDIGARVLGAYEIAARLTVKASGQLRLRIYTRGSRKPYIEFADRVSGRCGDVTADIRFFPRRAGAFQGLGVDGRLAYTWVRENSGVAVFDREFRISPYGEFGDDWLNLTADAARSNRHPRSSLAQKHFPMSDVQQRSTADNWMLRLPESAQLVGVVLTVGSRGAAKQAEGLIAAADREGFVANEAFAELVDVVRAAVEAIAMVDRRIQREREEAVQQKRVAALRAQAEAAAKEIQGNKNIAATDKKRLLTAISQMADTAEAHERATQERVRQLEVMSLLGVVAGYMTHEFGVAIDELRKARRVLEDALTTDPSLQESIDRLDLVEQRLTEFTDYSAAYIRGARTLPDKNYPAAPRLRHVRSAFERYAIERNVTIETHIASDVKAPLVPTSLYDGVLLNLLTNALKATTALLDPRTPRLISFRAWNEKEWHILEVADTGIGIPSALREQVFDPLFTTTASSDDPLGSGMGLGLSLVRASVEAFGGRVTIVDAPPQFSTCVRVRLPLGSKD